MGRNRYRWGGAGDTDEEHEIQITKQQLHMRDGEEREIHMRDGNKQDIQITNREERENLLR